MHKDTDKFFWLMGVRNQLFVFSAAKDTEITFLRDTHPMHKTQEMCSSKCSCGIFLNMAHMCGEGDHVMSSQDTYMRGHCYAVDCKWV